MKGYLFAILVVVLAACGGSDSTDEPDVGSASTPTTVAPAVQTETTRPPADVPETTVAQTDEPAASGGTVAITLTIGDETWEFPGSLCAYENAEPGSEGSEWNVSMKHGDLQVYISEDSYGSAVSITDVVNYGDLEWVAEADAVTLTIDGNTIKAEGTFSDLAIGLPDQEGTLTATCNSWHAG